MRKSFAALLIAAALPAFALAAPGPNGEHHAGPDAPHHQAMPGKRGGGLEGMDLTREQRQKIGQIMQNERKTYRDIHQRYLDKLPQNERDAMQKEFRDNHDKSQQEMRAVLTPEQQKRFDETRSKMKERQAEWEEFQQWKANQQKAQ